LDFDWGQKISPVLGQRYKTEAETNISISRPSCGQICGLEAETKAKTVASSSGKIEMLKLKADRGQCYDTKMWPKLRPDKNLGIRTETEDKTGF